MEIWKNGIETYCVFTEEPEEHVRLLKYAPTFATYQRHGVVFAWHHTLSSKELSDFKKLIAVRKKSRHPLA